MLHHTLLALGLAAGSLFALPALAADTRAVARAYYAAIESGAYDRPALEALFAPDYVDHDRPPALAAAATDREAILDLLAALAHGFPDGHRDLGLVEAAGADLAVIHFTFTGTQTGDFFGIPATGRKIAFSGIDILRVRDGVFTEQWHAEDVAGLMAQLTAK